MVERLLSMQEALGSMPRFSIFFTKITYFEAILNFLESIHIFTHINFLWQNS